MEHRITWGEFLLLIIAFGGPAYTLGAVMQHGWLRRSARASIRRRVAALLGGGLLAVPLTVVAMYASIRLPAVAWRSQGRMSDWVMYMILVTLPALAAAAVAFSVTAWAVSRRRPDS